MAIVTGNIALLGLSGMLGKKIVFRQYNGKTVVQAAPVRKAAYNEAQKKQQARFKEAMTYARQLLADPATKARYTGIAKSKRRNLTAFNIAVSEYLSKEVPVQRLCSPKISGRSPFQYKRIVQPCKSIFYNTVRINHLVLDKNVSALLTRSAKKPYLYPA